MGKEIYKRGCFICEGDCSKTNFSDDGDEDEELWKISLRNSLNVIFLLRKLLKVGRDELFEKLMENGDNPEDWIRICCECTEVIRRARELDEEMRINENELREDERKVKETIKISGDDKHGDGEAAYLGNRFGDKIRAFVKQDSFLRRIKNSEVKLEAPPVLTEDMLMPTKCFICDCTLTKVIIDDNDSNKLENNLDVVFLLRLLLKVPSRYIENQYKKCGPDPANWIRFCETCTRLARTARKLDADIRKIGKPLRSIQKDVILKIRCKTCLENGDENLSSFEGKICSFVKSSNYSVLNVDGVIDLNECSPQEYLIYLENPTEPKEPPPVELDKPKWIPKNSRVTEDGKFECGSCGKIYEKTSYFSEHQWKGHKIKEFPCPAENCGKILSTQLGNKFQKHWKFNHGKKIGKRKKIAPETDEEPSPAPTWPCEICGIKKISERALHLHRKKMHGIGPIREPIKKKEEEPQLCSWCGKEFSSQASLALHEKFVHEKKLEYTCHVCGMGFSNGFKLKKHLLMKHKEDPVTRKLVEEEGYQLLRCGVQGCRLKFMKKERLDKHMESWHGGGGGGNFKFVCGACGKGFWERYKLVSHENTHKKMEDRERKFKCGICGLGYVSNRNLWFHKKKIHPPKTKKSESLT